jgi:hypothetical protein
MQPAAIAWDTPTNVASYAHPGALLTIGRDNYDNSLFHDVSVAGGTLLLYLEPIVDISYGRYHEKLHLASEFGPATARWPGDLVCTSTTITGYLVDFRVGSVLLDKLPGVLALMVYENPHIGGFWADDVGSRSYYSGVNWDSWSNTDKDAYRAGAIAVCQIFRDVCDANGLIYLANGTWQGGDTHTVGGGYPDSSLHGCGLADGGVVEGHDGESQSFWNSYGASTQWGSLAPITGGGKGVMLTVGPSDAGRGPWESGGAYAYRVNQAQPDGYDPPSVPYGSFHATGLPSHVPTQFPVVAFDAVGPSSAGASSTASNTVTWSHTCSGSNRLLIVGVAVGANTSPTISSVTYNGVAMTSVGKMNTNNQTNAGFVELFRLIAPATGTNSVVVTTSAAVLTLAAGSVSFTGVHQVAPLGVPVLAFGDSTTPSVSVPNTSLGNVVIDAMCCGTAATASSQTLMWRRNINGGSGAGNGASSTVAATGGTMTLAHTQPADFWASVGVEVLYYSTGIVLYGTKYFSESFVTRDFRNFSAIQNNPSGGQDDTPGTYDQSPYNLKVVNGGLGHETAVRFEIRDGDVLPGSSSERNELVFPTSADVHEGDERWYQFDVRLGDPTWTNPTSWEVIFQWHQAASSGSPPIEIITHTDGTVKMSQSGITPVPSQVTLWTIRPGVWERVVVHAKFSTNPAIGFLHVYYNNTQVMPLTATQTMLDATNYVKCGIYRDGTHTSTQVVMYDNIKITSLGR